MKFVLPCCMILFAACVINAADQVESSYLFAPQKNLGMKPRNAGKVGIECIDGKWRITGQSPLHVEFIPAENESWNISAFRLMGVPLFNQSNGVTTVNGRLHNAKSAGEAPGFAVALKGERATLGFPFSVPEDRYHGPEVFKDQLAKPNGHRVHWRYFNPDTVKSLSLQISSSSGQVDLIVEAPFLAWPAEKDLDQKLEAMPYLDSLGQVRAVNWPGKSKDLLEARTALKLEFSMAEKTSNSGKFNRYGGWAQGPKREATGHFRTEKVDGKWWLIDPEGRLFFSVGVCSTGYGQETLINKRRKDAGFFEYLPPPENGEGEFKGVGRSAKNGMYFMNFSELNYTRYFGDEWQPVVRNGILNRLHSWGVNTLGAWSDESLLKDARSPYTLIIWIPKTMTSPFKQDFELGLKKSLEKYSWAKDDPFCLGVFIGNELDWPDQFTSCVFEMHDDDATKKWVLDRLKGKYPTLEELNAAWKTKSTNWAQVLKASPERIAGAAKKDIEPMYQDFAGAFFSKCKAAMTAVLPQKLYLGCRTHRGPPVIGRSAAGHVDVFSLNAYDFSVRAAQVPADVDIPVLIGEFHFGAVDRGVPGPGLAGSWDQRQRGLAFCHYLAGALANPRFVGVHWFQWQDQPASGRNDRENHQCGFVDVTGRSYPDFVFLVAQATHAMYEARMNGDDSPMQILATLLKEPSHSEGDSK